MLADQVVESVVGARDANPVVLDGFDLLAARLADLRDEVAEILLGLHVDDLLSEVAAVG